ncbi:hypothetical protein GCM10020256_26900 [Streptomyces thermocoprophilus]
MPHQSADSAGSAASRSPRTCQAGGEGGADPVGLELAAGDDEGRAEVGAGQGCAGGAEAYDVGLGVGEDGELAAGHPGSGVRLEVDGDAVEAGEGAEDGAGVEVVGEETAGGGEDAGAEVAGGELAQLPGEDGDGEGRQVGPEQGDAVALQEGADGEQAAFDARAGGAGVHDDEVAVLLDEGLHGEQRLVQRLPVDVRQDGGRHGPLVLRRQCQVGAGHGNGSWHAQLPIHACRCAGSG